MDKTVRKVILKGEWWKRATEPLTGFEKEGGSPVPLIPTIFGRYRGISEKRASELKEYAIASYELLPEKKLLPFDLLRLGLKHKARSLVQIGFLSLLAMAFSLVPLIALKWVFNHVFDEGDTKLMWQIVMLLSLAAFGSAFFLYIRNRAVLRLNGWMANRIQPAMWHRLFTLQMTLFQKISKSELIAKISSVDSMREGLTELTSQVFLSSLFSLLYLIAMFLFSPLYTCIVLPFIIMDIWLFALLLRHKSKLKNHIQGARMGLDSFLTQSLYGLKKIRSEGLERKIYLLWKKHFIEEQALEEKLENSHLRLELLNQYMPMVLFGVVMMAFMFFPTSLGNVAALYLALLYLSLSVREMTQTAFDFSTLLSKIKKTEKIMDEPTEKQEGKKMKLSGALRFSNVNEHFSFQIQQGERVGIVGGVHVTNMVRLLLGFEKRLAGEIFLDEHLIDDLLPSHYRSQIGVVFRTDGLFAGNIYDNIDLGRALSIEEINQALQLSGFKQDIDAFPMGLHTLIPSGGDTLSGGQKQKLLLTRALAGKPSILILDHALDCLDSTSLDQIMSNLKTLPITQIYVGENESLLQKYCSRLINL